MALIAELETKLTANTSNFTGGIATSLSSIDGFLKGVRNLAIAGVVIHELGTAFHEFASIITESTDKIAKLQEASVRLGVGVPELQRLQYAAEQSGIGIETLNKGLGFLERNISNATRGNKKIVETLGELNLVVGDLKKLGVDQQYSLIAKAIQEITDPADQARIAMTLFGRGGIAQLSLLKRDVGLLTDEFHTFGGELTGPQAQNVKEYAENIKRLSSIWDAFKLQLTSAVAGPFKSLLETITKLIIQMGGVGNAAKIAAGYIIGGMQSAISVFQFLLSITDRTIINFEIMIKLILRLNQIGTLGLSNYFAGVGDKIAALNKDIENREASLKTRTSTADRINQGLGGLQKQLTTQTNESNTVVHKVEVKISAEDGLKASIAESPEIKSKVTTIMNNIMGVSAASVGS